VGAADVHQDRHRHSNPNHHGYQNTTPIRVILDQKLQGFIINTGLFGGY
jgi:hypothetical protein